MLYCIVLYCIVLYCIVLFCTVLYCIVLYCIVLYCMHACMQRPRHMAHMIIASGCKMLTCGTLAELFREECLSEATTTSSGRGLELEFGDD